MEKSILEVSLKKDVGSQSLFSPQNQKVLVRFFELVDSISKANSRLPLLLRVFSTPVFTLSTTLIGTLFFIAYSLKVRLGLDGVVGSLLNSGIRIGSS